ncbi:MAG: transporter substrate-binding domain-containing protein [Pseudomonadota bacterium]
MGRLAALMALACLALAGQASASDTGAAPVQKSWKKIPQIARIQNPDRTFTPGADLDMIRARGWIEFGVYGDFFPYSWEDGEAVRGIDVDLGRLIAQELGVEARFRVMAADETVDDDLRNFVWKGPLIGPERNVVNVMMHVPWDRELDIRNELIVLTAKYMVEETAIAYDSAVYPDGGPVPAYFRFDPVAVENDSLADFYLSGIANGQLLPMMHRYPTVPEAMDALKAGTVKAVMGPLSQLQAAAGTAISVHKPPLPGLSMGRWTLSMAVRHNYRRLGYAVDDAIAAVIADGRMAEVFATYGVDFTAPQR